MISSHIHTRGVSVPRSAVDDWTVLASMQDAVAQSKIAIEQSLVAIASTREVIAFLDQLLAGRNSNVTR
jgi:hypothetical protein